MVDVEVVDVHLVFDDRAAEVIGLAVCQSALHTCAGHP